MNKRLYIICILMQFALTLHFCLYANDNNFHSGQQINSKVSSVSNNFSIAESVDLSLCGMQLVADSGSLLHDAEFSVSVLDQTETFPLRGDMIAVTGGYYAYRLLPHGEHFSQDKPARIELAYDPLSVPQGFKPQDIYSFYFDEQHHHWQQLHRIAVDTTQHIIISETTHFTDFVNAIVQQPEMPETSAFVPTQLTEMEEPHPLGGVPIIPEPQANAYGSALLTYPISIPAGRNNLQPDINLTYNSTTSNGVLGYGWTIPQPAITIDTRWGVPRYSSDYESEIYSINGQQMVQKDGNQDLRLPYQSTALLPRQNGDVTFTARDTKNCDLIVRHGTAPNNYWWSVTDRSGTTYYYGKYASDDVPNAQCVLKDGRGNIAYWALAEVVDMYGNFIKYEYNTSDNNEIYLKNIYYTGHKNTNGTIDLEPNYRVFFHYMERDDIIQDGRLGFVRQTDSLMCYIDVSDTQDQNTENDIITNHRYIIHYADNAESLITKINDFPYHGQQHWSNGGDCYSDINGWIYGPIVNSSVDFEYDMPQADDIFGEVQTISINSSPVLSKSSSQNWNVGGTATVGIGFDYPITNFSAGGNYNYAQSRGKTEQMMLDLNGDGLADLVYIKNGHIYYRAQKLDGNNDYFDEEVDTQIPSEGLSQDISHTNSWGLQAGAEAVAVNANISGGMSYTDTYTTSYFADINGDGLPDYVDDGKVYFNRLNSQNTFTRHQGETNVSINTDECNSNFYYTGEAIVADNECVIDTIIERYIPDSCFFINPYQTRVIITPTEPDSCWQVAQNNYQMWRNSVLYHYPNISITQIDDVFVATFYDTICPPKVDPDIEAVRVWVAPRSGDINLQSTIQLIEDPSESRQQSRNADGVIYVIQHNKNITTDAQTRTLHAQSKQRSYREIIADEYDAIIDNYNFSVSQGDVFFFHLMSKETHQFDNVDWQQEITYTDDNATYSSANDFVCSGNDIFQSPVNGTLSITFDVSCGSSNTATLKVYKGKTLASTYNIYSSIQSLSEQISYTADTAVYFVLSPITGNLGSVEVKCHCVFSPANSTDVIYAIDTWLVPRVEFTPECVLDSVYYELFGCLYRGWGQFAYNNTNASDTIPLHTLCNVTKLQSQNTQNIPTSEQNYLAMVQNMRNDSAKWKQQDGLSDLFADNNLYNPLDNAWIPMSADAAMYRYEAYGRVARNGRTLLSNTRTTQASVEALGNTGISGLQNLQIEDITIDSDVPVLANGQSTMVVRKEARSTQWNVNAGVGVGVGGLGCGVGRTYSQSNYEVTTDFMDMNGDRYPDIVRKGSIQYTQPWGGLGSRKSLPVTSYANQSTTIGQSSSGHFGVPQKTPSNNPKDGKFATNVSNGASTTIGNSETTITYMDINADGLPDKIIKQDNLVYACLNIGYGFAEQQIITDLSKIDENISTALGGNIGGGYSAEWGETVQELINFTGESSSTSTSVFQASITAGVDINWSENKMQRRLIDMDGDGLPDIVQQNGNAIIVQLLKPQGAQQQTSISDSKLQESKTLNTCVNLGLTVGFPVWAFIKMNVGLNGSPWGQSCTQTTSDLLDINGDGLPDLVWVDNGNIYVRYNQLGKKRLLKKVYNSTSQIYELDYTLSAPSTEQRGRQWLLTEVRNILPEPTLTSTDTISKRFTYSAPHYYATERTQMGYGVVETHEMHTNSNPHTVYRKQKRHYNNTDFLEHGKLIYEAVTDSLDRRYTEYKLGTLTYVDNTGQPTDNLCNDMVVKIQKEAHITTYFDPARNDSIVTAKEYDYDQYHNVTAYRNLGDITINDDNLTASITYADASSGTNKTNNLISLPEKVVVSNAGTPTRRTNATYNTQGKLIRYQNTDLINSDSLYQEYEYDAFGLPTLYTLPDNNRGQRATITVTYDTYSHTLPATVIDQFGRTTSHTYHHFWQKPTQTTDPTNSTIRYNYDNIGRLWTVQTYLDSTQTVTYNWFGQTITQQVPTSTITYTYIPCMQLRRQNPYIQSTIIARTKGMPNDTLFTQTDYDRRGRRLIHKERRVDDYWIAKDITQSDEFGRTTKIYKPYFTGSGTATINQNNLHVFSQTRYDILDRPTLLINSDNTQQSTLYGIGQDAFGVKRLMQQHTDENSQVWTQFTSPQGNITTNITPDEAITKFTYDALGQLLSTTDPDGMTTTHTYDGFGRRTQRTHPDAGTSRWSYDHAGNLIASQTQSQINRNQATHYHYTYNQLDSICYEQYPQTNVYYEYDAIGRISQRKDLTGTENFEYDKFGNVARSIRLIVMPNERAGYRFTTRFNYDVLGKMRKITYPDNEEVTYRYKYGKLMHIEGKIGNNSIVYLDTIEYDNFDAQDIVEYGNGYITDYAYNNRRWLSNLYVHNQDDNLPLTLQDIYYRYDGVGNITGINQTAGDVLGISADYQQNFVYDAQNRLTRTDMSSDNFGEHGDYDFAYSPSGMLHYRVCEDWNLGVIYGYNHDNDNHITNHQIHSLYDSYNTETYFLNWTPDGQLKTIAAPCRGYIRNHKWNDAGQLVAVVDNNHCGFYAYDGNGERVYKLTGSSMVRQVNAGQLVTLMHFDDAVMYVSPYVVISPKGYHKYYYSGSQRIASSISKTSENFAPNHILHLDSAAIKGRANAQSYFNAVLGNTDEVVYDVDETYISPNGAAYDQLQWDCMEDEEWTVQNYAVSDSNIIKKTLKFIPINQPIQQEQRYFYHTDHLGSSSWITDSLGMPIQFIHYQPYGELYINYKTTAYDERFKFTGKERDAETDYDYFGARYYASICPSFISVDPLAENYPGLNPYAYCGWNPIKYVDPDGMSYSDFDENGNYLGTVQDNWFHNTFIGKFGRIKNRDGKIKQYFSFADPNNDIKDLESGKINRIQFVKEYDIFALLKNAGALNTENNTTNKTLKDRYDFILKEGKGFGKLDFAGKADRGLSTIYGFETYTSLFLIDNVAHNTKNFGNFLFGAAGVSMGYYPIELLIGAHFNSLFFPSTNGYIPQLDSFDDQLSIMLGIQHAYKHQYMNLYNAK